MRDYWVCDIADFAKYGLTRALIAEDFRLGIVWYRTMKTIKAGQTKRLVNYLQRPCPNEYTACDEPLFVALRALNERVGDAVTIRTLQDAGVFPATTRFFDVPIDEATDRKEWFEKALHQTRDCDLLLMDPDTGLSPDLCPGPTYASVTEVLQAVSGNKSVILVQFGRPGNLERAPTLARQRLSELSTKLSKAGQPSPWGFWWPDQHKVALLVAPAAKHEQLLLQRSDSVSVHPGWETKITRL